MKYSILITLLLFLLTLSAQDDPFATYEKNTEDAKAATGPQGKVKVVNHCSSCPANYVEGLTNHLQILKPLEGSNTLFKILNIRMKTFTSSTTGKKEFVIPITIEYVVIDDQGNEKASGKFNRPRQTDIIAFRNSPEEAFDYALNTITRLTNSLYKEIDPEANQNMAVNRISGTWECSKKPQFSVTFLDDLNYLIFEDGEEIYKGTWEYNGKKAIYFTSNATGKKAKGYCYDVKAQSMYLYIPGVGKGCTWNRTK